MQQKISQHQRTNEPEQNEQKCLQLLREKHRYKRKKSSFVSFAVILLLILLVSVSVLFYINLDDQITEAKATISKKGAEHKIEVKVLSKKN
jgi:competence protein ComGC